jgi:hypothetical protein
MNLVVVKGSGGSGYWYRDAIGSVFEVEDAHAGYYKVLRTANNDEIVNLLEKDPERGRGIKVEDAILLDLGTAMEYYQLVQESESCESAVEIFLDRRAPKSTYLVMQEVELTDEEATLAEDEPTVRFIQKL